MNSKTYKHYKSVGSPTEKITTKKKRPKLMAVVDEDNCTGCMVCVPFCPTDCIEPVPQEKYRSPIPPVQVRFHECVGCQICAKVCTQLAWDAIRMLKVDDFEGEYGVAITDECHPGQASPESTKPVSLP